VKASRSAKSSLSGVCRHTYSFRFALKPPSPSPAQSSRRLAYQARAAAAARRTDTRHLRCNGPRRGYRQDRGALAFV